MSSSTEQPLFVHDCDKCVFLGRFRSKGSKEDRQYCNWDLYVCGDNVVARYGNDGPEYTSGMEFANGMSRPLTEAKKRAEASGVDFEALRVARRQDYLKKAYQAYKMHDDVIDMHKKLLAVYGASWMLDDNFETDMRFVLELADFKPKQIEAAIAFVKACNEEVI